MSQRQIVFEKSKEPINFMGSQLELWRVVLPKELMETWQGGGYLRENDSNELYIICGDKPRIMFRVPGVQEAQTKIKDVSVKFKKGKFTIPEHLLTGGLERAVLGKCELEGCSSPAYLRVSYETLGGDISAGFCVSGCSRAHTDAYKMARCENMGVYESTEDRRREIEARPFIILKAPGGQ